MGMFDYVRCDYPLTDRPKLNEKLKALEFQTKSTPEPRLDYYHVREDGSLWWKKGVDGAPSGKWVRSSFSGELNITAIASGHQFDFYQFNLFFDDGKVVGGSDRSFL